MKPGTETLWKVAENRQIERIKEGKRFFCDEVVVKEEVYRLFINEKEWTRFSCTPSNLEELAAGYALAETLIHQKEDIKSIRISEENHEILMAITEKKSIKEKQMPESVSLSSQAVFQLWRNFDEECIHFRLTGGLHAVALCNQQEVLFVKEDVARHNTLLKVLGGALLSDIPLADKCLFFSGRIAAQMVELLSKTEIKILLCHGAATLGAIKEAKIQGITLAGFVRNQYMNIYTGSHRIGGGLE